jgi:hypothetical protein
MMMMQLDDDDAYYTLSFIVEWNQIRRECLFGCCMFMSHFGMFSSVGCVCPKKVGPFPYNNE